MTGIGDGINQSRLLSNAGAILRTLTPAKIATLVLVRGGQSSQRAIAERLDRTSPAVYKYIETLESLPTPLVEKQERDIRATSLGKQVISSLCYFTDGRVDTDLQSEWSSETTDERLNQLDDCLSPLHEFRSDPPYYILYAIGCGGSSASWFDNPDLEPITIDDLTATVKDWLTDSIARTQIWERLRKFEDANTIEINEKSITLTDKGAGQCRLLDQIMQSFLDTMPVDNKDNGITAAYQSDTGVVLPLPRTLTVKELDAIVSDFKENNNDDLNLELVLDSNGCG